MVDGMAFYRPLISLTRPSHRNRQPGKQQGRRTHRQCRART